MLRLMTLTTAVAFALASSVASCRRQATAEGRRQASGDGRQQVTGEGRQQAAAEEPHRARGRAIAARPAARRLPLSHDGGAGHPAMPYRAPLPETDEALLITPAYGPGGYIANLPGTPLLPGATTIPGYYGRPFSYDYQGPYYGGPYEGYYWRLPYACGVYGYC